MRGLKINYLGVVGQLSLFARFSFFLFPSPIALPMPHCYVTGIGHAEGEARWGYMFQGSVDEFMRGPEVPEL